MVRRVCNISLCWSPLPKRLTRKIGISRKLSFLRPILLYIERRGEQYSLQSTLISHLYHKFYHPKPGHSCPGLAWPGLPYKVHIMSDIIQCSYGGGGNNHQFQGLIENSSTFSSSTCLILWPTKSPHLDVSTSFIDTEEIPGYKNIPSKGIFWKSDK